MKKIKNNQAIAHTTNSKKLTNAWKKPISFLLGVGMLACSSAICAGAERELRDGKHASSQVRHEHSHKKIEEERIAKYKPWAKLYPSLHQRTYTILKYINAWDFSSDITPEEEKIIMDMDTLIRKISQRPSELRSMNKAEEDQLFSLEIRLLNRKMFHINKE